MIDWLPVTDSKRVIASAYDADGERILVRFPDGKEWQYHGCPLTVWEEFIAPGTSKGTFIHQRLNFHANGPVVD